MTNYSADILCIGKETNVVVFSIVKAGKLRLKCGENSKESSLVSFNDSVLTFQTPFGFFSIVFLFGYSIIYHNWLDLKFLTKKVL